MIYKIILRICTITLISLVLSPHDAFAPPIIEGMRLGGNMEGARETTFQGLPSVETRRSGDDLEAILQNTQKLSDEGRFAKVHAIERSASGARIVMEHFAYSRSGQETVASGKMEQLYRAADLPVETKRELRRQTLAAALQHPDGHAANIMWRVVRTKSNDLRVDVAMVDPFVQEESMENKLMRLNSPERFRPAFFGRKDPVLSRRPAIDQYCATLQARTVAADLGLPEEPHPMSWLKIAEGHGLAAEAAAQERELRWSTPSAPSAPVKLATPGVTFFGSVNARMNIAASKAQSAMGSYSRADSMSGGMLSVAVSALPGMIEESTEGMVTKDHKNPFVTNSTGLMTFLFGDAQYMSDVPGYWMYQATGYNLKASPIYNYLP